ncbi:sulfatase [Pseudotabrizicola sediminis]|uniref:Sulfatase n=1 Tax=Pseudotabrizicola sediminis TaxID=2486418 RepID=A0ABY2KGS9_9RHOB|nr:sulfatase [Pseudotabrizicola sediminis]TGD41446.1 sulfatase [Pseudotabrizicola sediminis]
MRTIFVLFDSLNRSAMGVYGGTSVKTPHFDRFAQLAMTFDRHYVGSLPCMPARRDMHTGRLNFTHRSWGPLEPFDNSFAELLKKQGTYTHMISDHLHYFEDGGAGFHTRFNSWDFIRGQEYDPWVAMVKPPLERFREIYDERHYPLTRESKRFQAMINREAICDEADFPGPKCFAAGLEFLDRNHAADDWMLMLECFDPHEPFHAPERFHDAYDPKAGKVLDWPHYERVIENPEDIDGIRANYAALVAMCDDYFGKLLDYLDSHDMWKDTAVILTTDHGFLLSEHDWWGKCRMPYYEEVSHIPLMIHDPRFPQAAGQRTGALTQTADLMPTLLGLHGVPLPEEARARDLSVVLAEPACNGRDVAVFGVFGGPIGVTDGAHVLYYYPPDWQAEGLREYTLAPQHMTGPFAVRELKTARLSEGFDFTKGVPVLSIAALPDAPRVPMNDGAGFVDVGTRLYDLISDSAQQKPINNPELTARLLSQAVDVLRDHDTPDEVYQWYGLPVPEKTEREEIYENAK